MRHQYLMIDSRGNPVAHGTSDDGLEKAVWMDRKKTFGSSGSPTGISSGCCPMSMSAW